MKNIIKFLDSNNIKYTKTKVGSDLYFDNFCDCVTINICTMPGYEQNTLSCEEIKNFLSLLDRKKSYKIDTNQLFFTSENKLQSDVYIRIYKKIEYTNYRIKCDIMEKYKNLFFELQRIAKEYADMYYYRMTKDVDNQIQIYNDFSLLVEN